MSDESVHKAVKAGIDFYIMSIKNDKGSITDLSKKISTMEKDQIDGFLMGLFTAINSFTQVLADGLDVEIEEVANKAIVFLRDLKE